MLNECTPIEIPIIIGTGIPIPSINVQNYQPSLFTIAGHIKIRPFSSMLKQQAFPSPINSPQFLPISQLHSSLLPIPSPSLPISSFYFYPNFDKSHFNSLPLYHSNSKATVFPEDFPVTRYKGQSVLRIEEIE